MSFAHQVGRMAQFSDDAYNALPLGVSKRLRSSVRRGCNLAQGLGPQPHRALGLVAGRDPGGQLVRGTSAPSTPRAKGAQCRNARPPTPAVPRGARPSAALGATERLDQSASDAQAACFERELNSCVRKGDDTFDRVYGPKKVHEWEPASHAIGKVLSPCSRCSECRWTARFPRSCGRVRSRWR